MSFDRNRKFIRESKILARREVGVREFSILGFKIASFLFAHWCNNILKNRIS